MLSDLMKAVGDVLEPMGGTLSELLGELVGVSDRGSGMMELHWIDVVG